MRKIITINSPLNFNRRINLIYLINYIFLTINSSSSTVYQDVYRVSRVIILRRITLLKYLFHHLVYLRVNLKYKKLYTLHIVLKVFHTYIGTLSIVEKRLLKSREFQSLQLKFYSNVN